MNSYEKIICWFYLLILTSIAACNNTSDPTRLTATVEVGSLIYSTSFYGELVARNSIAIHTPDFSRINSLTIKTILRDGTIVKKGDTVLTFIDDPVEDELRSLEADLAVAKAEMLRVKQGLDQEQIDLELDAQRKEMAVERAKLNVVVGVNLISKLELEKAKLDLQNAKLELKLAQEALHAFSKKRSTTMEVQYLKVQAIQDKVKERLEQRDLMSIKAPADGAIFGPYTRLNWVRGKAAPGSVTRPGDKLLEIPELSAFDVHVYVRQRDATFLHVDDNVTVYATVLPNKALPATIVKKEAYVSTRNERLGTNNSEGNLKEILVVMELQETIPELKPGGTVRADVVSRIANDVLLVPLAAINKDDSDKTFVVMANNTKRIISIGKSSTTHAEVVEGLSKGEQVLLP